MEEIKKLLFEFQESQNHLQYERSYKEIIDKFKSLQKENKELKEKVKELENPKPMICEDVERECKMLKDYHESEIKQLLNK